MLLTEEVTEESSSSPILEEDDLPSRSNHDQPNVRRGSATDRNREEKKKGDTESVAIPQKKTRRGDRDDELHEEIRVLEEELARLRGDYTTADDEQQDAGEVGYVKRGEAVVKRWWSRKVVEPSEERVRKVLSKVFEAHSGDIKGGGEARRRRKGVHKWRRQGSQMETGFSSSNSNEFIASELMDMMMGSSNNDDINNRYNNDNDQEGSLRMSSSWVGGGGIDPSLQQTVRPFSTTTSARLLLSFLQPWINRGVVPGMEHLLGQAWSGYVLLLSDGSFPLSSSSSSSANLFLEGSEGKATGEVHHPSWIPLTAVAVGVLCYVLLLLLVVYCSFRLVRYSITCFRQHRFVKRFTQFARTEVHRKKRIKRQQEVKKGVHDETVHSNVQYRFKKGPRGNSNDDDNDEERTVVKEERSSEATESKTDDTDVSGFKFSSAEEPTTTNPMTAETGDEEVSEQAADESQEEVDEVDDNESSLFFTTGLLSSSIVTSRHRQVLWWVGLKCVAALFLFTIFFVGLSWVEDWFSLYSSSGPSSAAAATAGDPQRQTSYIGYIRSLCNSLIKGGEEGASGGDGSGINTSGGVLVTALRLLSSAVLGSSTAASRIIAQYLALTVGVRYILVGSIELLESAMNDLKSDVVQQALEMRDEAECKRLKLDATPDDDLSEGQTADPSLLFPSAAAGGKMLNIALSADGHSQKKKKKTSPFVSLEP